MARRWRDTSKAEGAHPAYRYLLASTSTVMPDEARIKDLRADYRAMAPMMFDDRPPSFDDILAKIAALQETINS